MTTDDHDPQGEEAAASGGIRPEPPPFEPAYQPGSVPEITVPDLAEDALGVSAQVLADAAIPTLTDQVETASTHESSDETVAGEPIGGGEDMAQEPQDRADTWQEQMQVRMTKLSGDIQTLNDRLDRLEQRAQTKANHG
jgi:hypothetical protein